MSSIWQEFYCNDCHGFIRIKLNVSINTAVKICCPNPKCDRHTDGHPRTIKGGMIVSDRADGPAEEICPPLSAYSKKSISATDYSRVGVELKPEALPKEESPPQETVFPARDPAADALIRESWFERYGYYPARRDE